MVFLIEARTAMLQLLQVRILGATPEAVKVLVSQIRQDQV